MMPVAGAKRGLHVDPVLPNVQRMCSFMADPSSRFVRVFGGSLHVTVMTKKRVLCVKARDNALQDKYMCKTLAGLLDRQLLTDDDQEDGPCNRATFACCVGIAGVHPMIYVLEADPDVVVRAVNTKTETVNTLKLSMTHIETPVCLACAATNELYICTRTAIYVASTSSDKCVAFAPEVEFKNIERVCVNEAQQKLCVADSGQLKFLRLGDPSQTEAEELHVITKDDVRCGISGLACDRNGKLYVTLKTSNQLVEIEPNKTQTVKSIKYAENGIVDMALCASGKLIFVTWEGVEVDMSRAKYNVLEAIDHMREPVHIKDADLTWKRGLLEAKMADDLRQQQLQQLQEDLLNGKCTVVVDDPGSNGTIDVKVNLALLARNSDFFKGFENFPCESEKVRLSGVQNEVFQHMLVFCYTKRLAESESKLKDIVFLGDMLSAANMYGFRTLLEYLQHVFMETVTHRNAFLKLGFAEKLQVHNLVRRMREYVRDNLALIARQTGGVHADGLSHESLLMCVKCMCEHEHAKSSA